jgi:beta-glucosidase-like glycosyl hydrolase
MVGLGHIALAAVVALGGEASDPHGAGAIDSIDFGSTASMAAHGASMQNATVVAGEGLGDERGLAFVPYYQPPPVPAPRGFRPVPGTGWIKFRMQIDPDQNATNYLTLKVFGAGCGHHGNETGVCITQLHHPERLTTALALKSDDDNAVVHACSPPFDTKPWCDAKLPLARRSELLVAQFTLPELISQMSGGMSAIERLGVPAYHYGYEALHGVIGGCPFADRCFTSFPCSSAAVQSFNRTSCESDHRPQRQLAVNTAAALQCRLTRATAVCTGHATGVAQNSEARAMYNTGRGGDGSGLPPGLHIRGPQLNPQRDPRWGRNTESPGEDAWLNGIYGAQLVRGGQGATVNGQYAGKFRKAVNEMVRTPSLHLRMKRATYLGSLQSIGAECACLRKFQKHFTAYQVEEWRDSLWDTANISLRDLSDYYFTPLRMTIKRAEVGAFMCAYDAVNGTGSCGNRWMNNEVVRNSWGWNGVIESDW